MKKTLLIINGYFPFERGEDYLENEMKYIDNFDEYIMCPILVYGDNTFIKNYHIPNCLQIINPIKKSILRFFKCVFFILVHSFFYLEIIDMIRSKKMTCSSFVILVRTTIKSTNVFFELKEKLGKKKSEVTLYSYWMAEPAVICVLLKKYSNIDIRKTVTRCHRFDVYEYANKQHYLPYRKFIFANIDAIYPISNDSYDYLEEKYKCFVHGKMQIQRLGTEDGRECCVKKNQVLRLVSCSWLRPVKRVGLIVKALISLKIPVEWTHYGDGEEMEKLQEMANGIIDTNIKINFAGRITNSEVLKAYHENEFDVFINVSENEGVPVSIMEAMSVGMLIIATDVGGTREIVKNEINGYLLPKDCSPNMIAEKIMKIYHMSLNEYSEARRSSRMLWEKLSSAKNNYRKMYNDLIN